MAEDERGSNALWFALRLYDYGDIETRTRLHLNGFVDDATSAAENIGAYLAAHGCDPDKPFNNEGFSWNLSQTLITRVGRRSVPDGRSRGSIRRARRDRTALRAVRQVRGHR